MKDYSMKNSRRVIFEKYKEFKFEMHCEQKKIYDYLSKVK